MSEPGAQRRAGRIVDRRVRHVEAQLVALGYFTVRFGIQPRRGYPPSDIPFKRFPHQALCSP